MAASVSAAATTPPPPFSRSSSLPSNQPRSPDTTSPIYPERAIRPLPKSRLKSKLSPEQASVIRYPPEPPPPPPMSPPIGFAEATAGMQGKNAVGVGAGGVVDRWRGVNGEMGHPSYYSDDRAQHPSSSSSAVHHHSHCTCGEEVGDDSGEDEVEFDHPDYRYAHATVTANNAAATVNGAAETVLDNVQRRLQEATSRANNASKSAPPPPTISATSSADGYESFENTSNKKKRKIPLSSASAASSSSMHQSQLSAEMASMGISGGPVDGAMDDITASTAVKGDYLPPLPPVPSGTSTGTGISGAGRGRYGRQNGRGGEHGVRRALGASNINSINGYHHHPPRPPAKGAVGEVRSANGKSSHPKLSRISLTCPFFTQTDPDFSPTTPTPTNTTGGIISQAIKNAAENQSGPITPQLLQNNGNSSYSSPASAKTQFTFSVESESANKMVDQQVAAAALAQGGGPPDQGQGGGYGGNVRSAVNGQPTGAQPGGGGGKVAQGTQTSRSQAPPSTTNSRQPPPSQPAQPPQAQPAPPPPPKPRRRPSKEYALQARQRRLQQEYTNYHSRPNPKDNQNGNFWICEFCEYEDIFGVPPLALIRQYEIKDRAERKRQAEKRRLLEKAKAKGRKKGGGKGKNKGGGSKAVGDPGRADAVRGEGGQHYDPNFLPRDGEEVGYFDDEIDDEIEEDEEEFDDEDEGGLLQSPSARHGIPPGGFPEDEYYPPKGAGVPAAGKRGG